MTTPEWNGGYRAQGEPYAAPGSAQPGPAAGQDSRAPRPAQPLPAEQPMPAAQGGTPYQQTLEYQAAQQYQGYRQPQGYQEPQNPREYQQPQQYGAPHQSQQPQQYGAAPQSEAAQWYQEAQYEAAPAAPAVPQYAAAPERGPVPQYQAGQEQPAGEPGPAAAVRTGSPIIAPGLQPAALTAALGALTAAAASLGHAALAVPAVLLQGLTAAGWFRLNGMWPARQGIALAFLAGLVLDGGLFAVGGQHAPAVAAGALGIWLPLVLVQQLRHRGSADERLASLTATAAATVLAVLAGGYLAVAGTAAGAAPVVVGASAVAVAALLRALPLPGPVGAVLSLLGAAGSGVLSGPAAGLGTAPAALLALAAGGCALLGLRVASYDFPSRFVHFTAGVALPLTAAAPVVYLLGQTLR